MRKTVLYLLRHGATAANISKPPVLQGRQQNPPLAPVGVRQAEVTRDLLAIRAIDQCYTSPLLRAVQTATIITAPHGIKPRVCEEIIEGDVGRWEGLDWESIRQREPQSYAKYMADPGSFGYPEGESFREVYERAAPALDKILRSHPGQTVLIVSHNIVNRTYLAVLLGLSIAQARQVKLDNCGISVVEHDKSGTVVTTVNAAFHLKGAAV